MASEASRAHPHECCGILLGEGDRITAIRPARNVHPRPATHFEIDPQALIDAHRAERGGGPKVLGYYHSHPTGLPEPSATDKASASGDGRIWAIISGDAVRLWRAENRVAVIVYSLEDALEVARMSPEVMISVSIDPTGTVEVVQSHRRQLIQTMRHFTHLKASPSADTATLLMCDAELFRLEAAIRWLDSVDARIRSGASVTSPATSPTTSPTPESTRSQELSS